MGKIIPVYSICCHNMMPWCFLALFFQNFLNFIFRTIFPLMKIPYVLASRFQNTFLFKNLLHNDSLSDPPLDGEYNINGVFNSLTSHSIIRN